MTLLVVGGDVVTMNARRDVLLGATIVIDDGRIVAIGPGAGLRAAHPDADVLDVTGCVVTPGLVDAHRHLTADPLVRSAIPDRITSDAAIFEWAVPLHGALDGDDDELAAMLSALEGLHYGVTTVIEAGTVAHPERAAAGLARAGQRATIGTWGWDPLGASNAPSADAVAPYAASADEVLDRQRAVLDAFPPGGLIEGWVTLVGHDLASDALLASAADLARSRGTGLTFHLSPTPADGAAYRARTGRSPVEHLAHLGVLGPHLLLAHAVWVDDAELDLLLATDTAVASCPWAYLRLGQGYTVAGRHAELVERGGRVALGTDSANAADLPDILRAAALFAGLARDRAADPEAFGADDALALATIDGARAVGLGDRIGSLEPGKRADLVVHDQTAPAWRPRGDLALQLVWGTDGRSVRDVVVDGRIVIRHGRSTRVDEADLARHADDARQRVLARAGLPTGAATDQRRRTRPLNS